MEFRSGAICRLCLCENDCFFSIFVINRIYGYVPALVISDLLDVEVSDNDGYPHVICLPCLTKLTNYKAFKEQCHSARSTFDKTFGRRSSAILPDTVAAVEIKEEPTPEESCQYAEQGISPETNTETNPNQWGMPEIKQEDVNIEEESFSQTMDPMSPESSTVTEGVDEHFQCLPMRSPHVIRSIRGKVKLVDSNKYIYMEQKKNIGGTKTYWKCEVRDCKARVHTWSSNQESYNIIKSIGEHHHAPSPVKPKIRKILDRMKVLAVTTDLSVQALISSALQNLDESEVFQLPSVSCMSRNIRNWRQAASSERAQPQWIGNS